jgi:hypothetical protein
MFEEEFTGGDNTESHFWRQKGDGWGYGAYGDPLGGGDGCGTDCEYHLYGYIDGSGRGYSKRNGNGYSIVLEECD